VSTFYLLPPRSVLGERLASFLHAILPGLDWDTATRSNLADAIEAAASVHENVYVVYREDLPAGEHPALSLTEGYGAEIGDEVVEVRASTRAGELTTRRWRISA
jgi:hypothetical protein